MPASSAGVTLCTAPARNFGSTVTANRVLRVLAGASRWCAFLAASTSPVRTSVTVQARADTPSGSAGAPAPATVRPVRSPSWSATCPLAAPAPGSTARRPTATCSARATADMEVSVSTVAATTASTPAFRDRSV